MVLVLHICNTLYVNYIKYARFEIRDLSTFAVTIIIVSQLINDYYTQKRLLVVTI